MTEVLMKELFDAQRKLQEDIKLEEHYTHPMYWNHLILAALVEVGECANEWRGFKIWSKKKNTPNTLAVRHETMMEEDKEYYNPLLEEFVDGLHFILVLGLVIHADEIYGDLAFNSEGLSIRVTNTTESQFVIICDKIIQLRDGKMLSDWRGLFRLYMGLASMLGFKPSEVIVAYYKKNSINHKRQEQGY